MGIAYLHLLGVIAVTAASAEMPIQMIQNAPTSGTSGMLIQALVWGAILGLTFPLVWMSPGPLKYIVFTVYAVILGQMMVPLVKLLQDEDLLRSTLISTGGIFGGMTILSFLAPARSLSMGPYLFAALLGLICAQFIGFFAGVTDAVSATTLKPVQRIAAWVGTGLFALYVAHDTQVMRVRVSAPSPDYVAASIDLYLDILNLFSELGVARS